MKKEFNPLAMTIWQSKVSIDAGGHKINSQDILLYVVKRGSLDVFHMFCLFLSYIYSKVKQLQKSMCRLCKYNNFRF